MIDFCHLHLHNEYSLLDGLGKANKYAERAKEIGQNHIALTNHGNVDGCIVWQKACDEIGIHSIHGCEFYVVPDASIKEGKEFRGHMTILAKNSKGWQAILRLLTKANLEGFYKRPRIGYNWLLEEDLSGTVIMSACVGSYLKLIDGEKLLQDFIDKDYDLYLEVMPHIPDMQREWNYKILDISKKYKVPIVSTFDTHYILPEDEKAQEVLLAVQNKSKWHDKNRFKFDFHGLYLSSSDEVYNLFKKQSVLNRKEIVESMINTVDIAERCNYDIEKLPVYLPDIVGMPKGESDEDSLRRICEEGFERIILSSKVKRKKVEEYRSRLDEETDVIINQGFARYFLIVWELIKWCKDNNIMVGPGRGSAGGSLCCYLLGITAVDPIEYKLLFARFISPARIDLPDIDMDFEDRYRDKVRKHLEDVYGKDNVAGISTFLYMKGKGSLRDVSRVFDVPITEVNAAADSIVVRSGGDFRSSYTIEDAFQTFEDGIKFKKKYPEVTELAIKLEGQIRGVGMHAAGIVVSKEDLRSGNRAALCTRRGDSTVVNWGKEDLEHVGLMKLDILGLNALSILHETKDRVEREKGICIDFDSISFDDKKVFAEFSKGNTIGVFQFNSLGMKSFCRDLGIDDFDTLVAANALWRPGTLRSGMVTVFTDRKNGKEDVPKKHPAIEAITKDTYGIILYQEQLMLFMYELAGMPWKTADMVRKVVSKSKGEEQFKKFKTVFVEGCLKKKTLDKKTASKLFDELTSFGSYGFNLSHSVEYSVISYWEMFCKVYYPAEFIACSLELGGDQHKQELINEAIRLGLKVEFPFAGKSKAKEWHVENNKIYIPYSEIKGIGDKTVNSIEKSIDEYLRNTPRKRKPLDLSDGITRKGFFNSKDPDLPIKKTNRYVPALQEMGVFDAYRDMENDESVRISSKYFPFVVGDSFYNIKGISEILKKSGIKLVDDFEKTRTGETFFSFLRMTEVKLGYKASVSRAKTVDTSGTADSSLGGVYGFVKSPTGSTTMAVFQSSLYSRKKEKVEHCGDKWILVELKKTRKNVLCSEMWDEEELLQGKFSSVGVNTIHSAKNSYDSWKKDYFKRLDSCKDCNLNEECEGPVPFSSGNKNLMIIGEAPGREEDRAAEGFIGDSGKLLWKELGNYGLYREMFHVTNIVKCYPGKAIKTPDRIHIRKCSSHLEEEFKRVAPVFVLVFGNTAMKYFKDKDSGIMDMSGKIEWDWKHNCWLVWSIHPAAVLYHRENKTLFEKALKAFAGRIQRFSVNKNLKDTEV
jgi:DNA polymerase III subunit alpha